MTYTYQDYLAHYGVKGMRWGHRKDVYKKAADKLSSISTKKKESIRQKAVDENKNKIYVNEQELKSWKNEERKVKNAKDQYISKENWKVDLAYAQSQAKRSQARVDAWKRREKRLMSMDVSKLSTRQVKKATKLKFHEFAYPDE